MKQALKWYWHPLPILASFLLLYWGYCWGWWGRNSELLAVLFACACPPISEELRYPDYIDVLAPACGNPSSGDISPNKRLIVIRTRESFWRNSKQYIYDLTSRHEINTSLPLNYGIFFSNDAFINTGDEPPRLVNITDGTIILLKNVEDFPDILKFLSLEMAKTAHYCADVIRTLKIEKQ